MSAPGAVNPPPARGGNKITGFIKRNKLLVGAAGLGGGILLLSKSGSSGDSGDSQIVDSEGDTSTVSDGPVQLVPVAGAPSEGSDDSDVFPNDPVDDQPIGIDPMEQTPKPGTTVIVNVPGNNTGAPPPKNPAVGHTTGVTVHGRFFPGASSHRIVDTKNGSHGGQYQIHLISFPGRNEYWWYYTKGSMSGRWTGPHRSPGSGPAKPTAPKPGTSKPAPKPKQTLYAGHPLSYWQDPKHSRKNGKWQWPSKPGHFTHSRAYKK